jgi:hypothetical protein
MDSRVAGLNWLRISFNDRLLVRGVEALDFTTSSFVGYVVFQLI